MKLHIFIFAATTALCAVTALSGCMVGDLTPSDPIDYTIVQPVKATPFGYQIEVESLADVCMAVVFISAQDQSNLEDYYNVRLQDGGSFVLEDAALASLFPPDKISLVAAYLEPGHACNGRTLVYKARSDLRLPHKGVQTIPL